MQENRAGYDRHKRNQLSATWLASSEQREPSAITRGDWDGTGVFGAE
ncbi:hypothetical protein [Bacillus vallismortis]|nr:hypothetical protein [Bacillus vallismortis]